MCSVYIKGMDMPTSCAECELLVHCDGCEGYPNECAPTGGEVGYDSAAYLKPEFKYFVTPMDKRMDFCPLVEVPQHDRLIGADALYKAFCSEEDAEGSLFSLSAIKDLIDEAPTVIEAEE